MAAQTRHDGARRARAVQSIPRRAAGEGRIASLRGARPVVPGILGMAGARARYHARHVTSRGQSNENAVTDGREVVVMSAPVRNGEGTPSTFPTMYAPPWARGAAGDAGDAGLAAVDKALNASEEFRRTLPPAASLEDGKRWRDKPFEGDLAVKRLRERPTLDPVAMPVPPMPTRGASATLAARVAGAVGLAALAAFVVVGAMPQSRPLATAAQDPLPKRPGRRQSSRNRSRPSACSFPPSRRHSRSASPACP